MKVKRKILTLDDRLKRNKHMVSKWNAAVAQGV